MEFGNLFEDSLSYPASNLKKLLIYGIIFIIFILISGGAAFVGLGMKNTILGVILAVVAFIVSLIISGYLVSITKISINKSKEVPSFECKNNLVMGIKCLILNIVYYIIPTIITLLVAYLSGFFNTNALTAPAQPLPPFNGSIAITVIIAFILFVIFNIMAIIGVCRLANTDSLIVGLNISEVWKDLTKIGWSNFILWYIISIIILIVLTYIAQLIGTIPYIGVIIATLIITPFIGMYAARSAGLMYASKE